MPYEVIEHTADIGLKIRGRDLEGIFRDTALGLFNLMTNIQRVEGRQGPSLHHSWKLEAASGGDLLLKWARELLFAFSARREVFYRFDFELLTENSLKARGTGRTFDPARDEQKYEVKAVTYHGFKFEKDGKGWIAEIIFDI